MTENRVTIRMIGRSSGKVTIAEALPAAGAVDRRRLVEFGRHRLQPGEQGDAVEGQPAPGVDDDDRDHRQASDCRARTGRASASRAPTSSRLTTLKAGSSIHSQATVLSTVGTMNGSSSSARTRFFMRKCWFMASARPSPPTIFSSVATTGVDEGVDRHPPEDRVVRSR